MSILDFKRARTVQEELAKHVILKDDITYPPKFIAGLDISYKSGKAVACCVILDYKTLNVVEVRLVKENIVVPYVPTFLAYRELPYYVYLCYDFKNRNDVVILVDGHGLAHPRKMGIACHLGVTLNIPTIGVAKKILTGKIVSIKSKKYLQLKDGTLAAVIVERRAYSPLYVSPGHKVSLKTAEKIVLKTLTNEYRLPKPIQLAHNFSKMESRRL